jgi:hypothetical protein
LEISYKPLAQLAQQTDISASSSRSEKILLFFRLRKTAAVQKFYDDNPEERPNFFYKILSGVHDGEISSTGILFSGEAWSNLDG